MSDDPANLLRTQQINFSVRPQHVRMTCNPTLVWCFLSKDPLQIPAWTLYCHKLECLNYMTSAIMCVYLYLTGWQQTWKTWNTRGLLWTWKTQGILREFCGTSGKNCNKQSILVRHSNICVKQLLPYFAGVDVEWSLMKVIITFTFCCDNLWKSKFMASGKADKTQGIFSPILWPASLILRSCFWKPSKNIKDEHWRATPLSFNAFFLGYLSEYPPETSVPAKDLRRWQYVLVFTQLFF